MIDAIGTAFTRMINWAGEFITALTDTTSTTPGALTALLPLFAIGISVSLILVCVKLVRKVVWGA